MLVGISYTWWLMLVSDKGTLDHLSEWVEIAQDIKLKKEDYTSSPWKWFSSRMSRNWLLNNLLNFVK